MKKIHLNVLSSAILLALGNSALADTKVTTINITLTAPNAEGTSAPKPEASTTTGSTTPTTTTIKPTVTDSTATPSTTKPTVTDALGTPTTTKPATDYSKLDAKAVAALSLDVVSKLTAKQIAALKPDAVAGFSALQLKNISPDAMKGFSAEQIAKLSPDAVKGFSAEQLRALDPHAAKGFTATQIKNITPEAFRGFGAKHINKLSKDAVSGITPEQFSLLTRDAVGGFSVEQFKNIRLELLTSLNASNIGGLSREVLREFGAEILARLDIKEVKKLTSVDVTAIFLNIDIKKLKAKDIKVYLPAGYSVNEDTGKLTLPVGKVSLPPLTVNINTTINVNVELPSLPDLSTSLNVGGTSTQQTDMLTQLNQTLVQINYPQFTVSQTDTGIMKVAGTGSSKGVDLAFIPDQDKTETVASDVAPGLYTTSSGHIVLITTAGMKFTLIAAPQDPVRLAKVIPKGKVKMGKKGETRLELPDNNRVICGLFDAFVEPAPKGAKPGVTIQGTAGVDEVAVVVYEDGTQQKLRPSVQDQDGLVNAKNFLSDASKYLKHKFSADGNIHFLYGDVYFISKPTFDIQVNYTTAQARPVINVLDGGKKAELINEDGDRQVFNLEVVGTSSTYQDE